MGPYQGSSGRLTSDLAQIAKVRRRYKKYSNSGGDRYDLTRVSCRHVRGESIREQRQMCDGDLDRSGRYSVTEFP